MAKNREQWRLLSFPVESEWLEASVKFDGVRHVGIVGFPFPVFIGLPVVHHSHQVVKLVENQRSTGLAFIAGWH